MIALLAAAAASRTRRSTLKLRNVKDGGLEAVLSLPRA
jgi:hypothetical protein